MRITIRSSVFGIAVLHRESATLLNDNSIRILLIRRILHLTFGDFVVFALHFNVVSDC